MTGFHTLNTSPMDNLFCAGMASQKDCICSHCYSRRALCSYAKQAREPWKRNGKILSKGIIADKDLPTTEKDYFRFHSHGEIINRTHLINFINIAKKNPDTKFVLYTKRKNIVKDVGKMGAENLRYIYSEPHINNLVEELPEGFDGRFSVFTEEYAEENDIEINCAGKRCMDCLQCYNGDVVYVNELIK